MTGTALIAACAMTVLALAAPLPGAAETPALPDLVVVPAYLVRVGAVDGGEFDPASPRALRFTSATENHGAAPFDLTAVPIAPDRAVARQCLAWDSGLCTATKEVGTYLWHGIHLHWHMPDFFEYRLTSPDGVTAAASTRRSYVCIRDSEPAGAPVNPYTNLSSYTQCLDSRSGISPGWRYRLISTVTEQQIPLTGVPDGRYLLEVTVDPDDVMAEDDETNNTAGLAIELAAGGTRVTVLDTAS